MHFTFYFFTSEYCDNARSNNSHPEVSSPMKNTNNPKDMDMPEREKKLRKIARENRKAATTEPGERILVDITPTRIPCGKHKDSYARALTTAVRRHLDISHKCIKDVSNIQKEAVRHFMDV